MVKKNLYEKDVEKARKIEIAKEQKKKEDKIDAFKKKVESSEDLNDNLQDLATHLKDFTNSTAVYIGKIAKPIKGIS